MMALSSSHLAGGSMNASQPPAAGPGAVESYSSFPAVKTDEALSILKELSLHLAPDDITKPQPAVVLKVFCAFLEALNGITMEWVERQKHINLGQMEYKIIYDDGMFWMMIFREIRAMMIASQIQDFQMQDLTRPQPKRFKRQLSALVNFYRFRQDRVSEFEQLNSEADELDMRRHELRLEVETLARRLEEEKTRREAEEPDVQELKGENVKLRDQLMQLKKDQQKYMADIDAWKTEKNAMIQRQTELTTTLQSVASEVRKLQGRIVESPEELKDTLTRLANELKEEGRVKVEVTQRLEEFTSRVQRMIGLQKEAQVYVNLVQDAVRADTEARNAQLELDEQQALANQLEEAYDQLLGDLDRNSKKLYHAQERHTRMRNILDDMRRKVEMERTETEARLVEARQAKADGQKYVEALTKEADELEKEYTKIMQDYDRAHAAAVSERNELVKAATLYMDKMERRFQST